MLCALILRMSDGTYSLKSTLNNWFLRSFSWQFYLLSEFLPEICWEEVAEEIFSNFSFVLMSNLVSHTAYVVCFNFYTWVASFESTPNEGFLRNFSWQFLFALRGSRRRNIFLYFFFFDARPGIWTWALPKVSKFSCSKIP